MNKEKLKESYFKFNRFLKENILVLLLLTVFLLRANFTSIKFLLSPIKKRVYTVASKNKPYNNSGIMFKSIAMADETEEMKTVDSLMSVKKTMASGSNTSKKIVKNSSLSIEVSDTNNSKIKLEKDIERVNGFIENYYSYDFYGKTAFNFAIKIPSQKLTSFLNQVKKYGDLKNENFSLVDKTEQYNDNQNRLINLYTRRESLRKMMTTKTAKLSDILAVDRELNDVQYEIERFEKNNKIIDREVEYSRVDLTLTPEVIRQEKIEKWKITTSFKIALLLLLKVLKKIADLIIILLVFSPLILCCYLIYKKIIKSIK